MPPAVAKTIVALAILLAGHGDARAHALAQRYDLPLPLAYFLLASAAVVGVSFVILALFMRRPAIAAMRDFERRPLARGVIPGALVILAQSIGIAILALLVAAGLFGNQGTFKNITPVGVWVIWWIGLTLVSAFIGNVWGLINPWSAVFEWVEKLARLCGGQNLAPRFRYPAGLGAWPACVMFLLFAWFELVVEGRDVPRNIAIAIAIYSAITWLGFALFGRETWLKNGEVFSIVFGLIGRFAPIDLVRIRRWEWRFRPYAAGLLARKPLTPSMTALTLLVLGTVTTDGLMETPLWSSFVEWLLAGREAARPLLYPLLATLLLIVGPLLLAMIYFGVILLMTSIAPSPGVSIVAGSFVLSLVPIAIAYHVSHYFSLLAVAGQFIIPLASDPFGHGWDLFGTTLYRIDIGIVDARFIWYLCVIAIVTGHVIAVCLAHVTAFAVYGDEKSARRSQYPMVALMIGYTMLSLWILAEPIVRG